MHGAPCDARWSLMSNLLSRIRISQFHYRDSAISLILPPSAVGAVCASRLLRRGATQFSRPEGLGHRTARSDSACAASPAQALSLRVSPPIDGRPTFAVSPKGASFRLVPYPCFARLALQSEIFNFKFEILFPAIFRLRHQLKTHPTLPAEGGAKDGHPQNPRLNSGVNCSSGISRQLWMQSKEGSATSRKRVGCEH